MSPGHGMRARTRWRTSGPLDVLHVNSERVIVRVVGEDGRVAAAGQRGKVLVTDLSNQVMPFLTYDIGDEAVPGPPCPCGRASRR